MAENNKDGYVQHANVGRRSIIDIDEANSNFEVAGDKITGIVKGSITKEYQGNTDNFQLNLNNIPFIGGGGSGGGSGVETLVVTAEGGDSGFTVTNTSMTFDELEAAILDGKTVLGFIESTSDNGFRYSTQIDLSYNVGPISPRDKTPALFDINGISNASCDQIGNETSIMYVSLWWDRKDDLPNVRAITYKVVSASVSGGGGAV